MKVTFTVDFTDGGSDKIADFLTVLEAGMDTRISKLSAQMGTLLTMSAAILAMIPQPGSEQLGADDIAALDTMEQQVETLAAQFAAVLPPPASPVTGDSGSETGTGAGSVAGSIAPAAAPASASPTAHAGLSAVGTT